MTNANEEYNNNLLDKIMEIRSRNNYMDGAIKFYAEAELNPGMEDVMLEKAKILALMEIARLMNMMNQRPY